jgi:hypothetical protein
VRNLNQSKACDLILELRESGFQCEEAELPEIAQGRSWMEVTWPLIGLRIQERGS